MLLFVLALALLNISFGEIREIEKIVNKNKKISLKINIYKKEHYRKRLKKGIWSRPCYNLIQRRKIGPEIGTLDCIPNYVFNLPLGNCKKNWICKKKKFKAFVILDLFIS